MKFTENILFFLIICGSILVPEISIAQIKTFQFEQIDSLQNLEKRNVVIFIHTDWCKYCQTMKNTTLKNDSIISILNKNFYFINLNAEEKRNITFHRHIFKYKPTGNDTGINELVEQLGTIDNKVSYPTLCFLNSDYEIIYQYNQYINSTDLLKILSRLK